MTATDDDADEGRGCMWDTLIAEVNPDSNRQLYNIWAPTYDDDMSEAAYRAPALVANLVKETLNLVPTVKILDVGCGTGLLGGELSRREYKSVDGLDFSFQMLRKARKRDCYGACELQKIHPEMKEPPIPEGVKHRYDLIVFCSSIAPGHISPACIPLFLPHMKKNAHVVFTMIQPTSKVTKASIFHADKFLDYIQKICQEKSLFLVSLDDVANYIIGKPGKIGVLRKV